MASCQVCIRVKTHEKNRPYQQTKVTSINEAISMDCIGKLEGNRKHYIINVVILSIGYIMGKAVKSLSSRVVGDVLFTYCCTYGVPKRILTDLGKEFFSKVMVHLRNRLGYKNVYATSKNKRSGSTIENRNRTVNNGLIAQMLQNLDSYLNFDLYLEGMYFSINTMRSSKRKYSPAQLLFGYQPEFAIDLSKKKIRVNGTEDIDERLKRMNSIRLLHREFNEELKFFKNLKRNEKLGQLSDYQIGDVVWLYRNENRKGHHVTKKYEPKKTGPVTVVSRNEKAETYGVMDMATGYSAKVHARFLSPYGTFRELPDKEEEPDESDSSGYESDGDEYDSQKSEDEEEPVLPPPPPIDDKGMPVLPLSPPNDEDINIRG